VTGWGGVSAEQQPYHGAAPIIGWSIWFHGWLYLAFQTSTDQEIKNATCNGWLSEHFVSNVFAFTASGVYITANFLFCFCFANLLSRSTGEIIACKLNVLGSWHDSCIVCPIYRKLHDQTLEGFYLVTDTAFPQGTDQIKGHTGHQ